MKTIAVFISGNGSNLQNLINECKTNLSDKCKIDLVISNTSNAEGLKIASNNQIYAAIYTNQEYHIVSQLCKNRKIDYIFLAGFMSIIPKFFVEDWQNKIFNIHPSLLPNFKGKNAIKQALDYGAKITGATVHYVNDELDGGKIIMQKEVKILPEETEETLLKKVQEIEKIIYPQVLNDLINEKL